jgi:hypothetical protein
VRAKRFLTARRDRLDVGLIDECLDDFLLGRVVVAFLGLSSLRHLDSGSTSHTEIETGIIEIQKREPAVDPSHKGRFTNDIH